MAGITTPFTTPSFPFLQTVSQRTLDNIAPAFVLSSGPTVVPVGGRLVDPGDRRVATELVVRAVRHAGLVDVVADDVEVGE